MISRVEAAFYKDNDSIAIIDSLTFNKQLNALLIAKDKAVVYNQVLAIPLLTNQISKSLDNDKREEISVTSSITMELLLSRQSLLDTRIDRVYATIAQILSILQSRKVSSFSLD